MQPDEMLALQIRQNIQARSRWVLRAVGLDDPKLGPEESYMLAGAVRADREVERLAAQEAHKIRDPEWPCAFETDWFKLGAALGPAGRAALAERVRGMGRS